VPASSADLDRLLRWFSVSISHPGGVREGLQSDLAAELMPAASRSLETVVLPSAALSALERLSIYGNMYFDRLIDIMADEFPSVRQLIGSANFTEIVRRYITRYPSRHYSLAQLGGRFAQFLREDTDGPSIPQRPFAAAVATVERSMEDVFDAAQAEPLRVDELEAVSAERWGGLRFKTIPAFRLLVLDYPVNAFITAVREQRQVDVPDPKTAYVAIYRKNYRVWRVDLNAHQHALLAALHSGSTLEDALCQCAELPGFDETTLAKAVQEWFREWASEGLFRNPEEIAAAN
jgi:hypothetical protein